MEGQLIAHYQIVRKVGGGGMPGYPGGGMPGYPGGGKGGGMPGYPGGGMPGYPGGGKGGGVVRPTTPDDEGAKVAAALLVLRRKN